MAPVPSRVAPGPGDNYIAKADKVPAKRPMNTDQPTETEQGKDWIKRLPQNVKRAWGICPSPSSPPPPPLAYVYHRRPGRPGLPRSPWQPDLSSQANSQPPVHHRASSSHDQASAHSQAFLRDRASLHSCGDHSHSLSQDQAPHYHDQSGPSHLRSGSQDCPLPPHPSPPNNEPPPHYPDFIEYGGHQIPSGELVDHFERTVSYVSNFYKPESRGILKEAADEFLDNILDQALKSPEEETECGDSVADTSVASDADTSIEFVDESAEGVTDPTITHERSSSSPASSLFVDNPAGVVTNPTFTPEHSSSPSASSICVDEQVEFIDQSVNIVTDPATSQEHSSCSSSLVAVEPPVESKRRVRHRVRNNKKKGRKVRARMMARMMAQRTANPLKLAEGSTGIATPPRIAETLITSDADIVCSPSPFPLPLFTTQGMHPLPAAPATVPMAAPAKKKKKKGKKKKGNRQAPSAGGNNTGVSSDAQLTVSTAPTLEPGVFNEGFPSEVEIPAGITTGQDRSPCASEGPSLTVVSGVEASGKPTPPKEEYVGPCIVDTESWRQRMLARQQEVEAKREAGFLATTPDVGDMFSYSGYQSENSWAQMPMGGHSAPTQYSQGGGHKIGYPQPRSGALARAECAWKPRCCHHYQGSPSCSCCCLHGAIKCWFESDLPREDGPPAPLPADTQEPALMSQVSSPNSSSLGEPVSEPIVESVVSVFAAANTDTNLDLPSSVQVTTSPEVAPAMSTSTPANIMAPLQAHPGEDFTAEDLKSPSLYFDAKSKNLSSSPLSSNESREASRETSPMPGEKAQGASKVVDRLETRNQGYQTVLVDTRRQSSQTEATGPLAFQTEHVQALFGNPEFADIQLLLSPDMHHPPIVYHLYKAIIASSPFLYNVMTAKQYREGRVDHIRAFTGVSFTCSHAFTMALQVLYGAPLVTNDILRKVTLQGLGLPDNGENSTFSFSLERAMVDFALCYAATGALLARREITERGIDMAISHLSWETAEFLLNFGMTPLTYMVTCPDVPFPPISPPNSRASSLSSGNGNGTPVVGIDHFHDFHYVQANRALNAALRFITNAITPDFELYRRAQARYTPSRIPPAVHTLPGSCLSNPRLEEIRFGSLPSFADLRPTDPAILVPSAMLLTLPYRVFIIALDLIKARGNFNSEVIREVVEERESRRLNALRVSLRVGAWQLPPDAFAELEYREFIKVELPEHTDDDRLRALRTTVDRVWVGADVPNSALLRTACVPAPGTDRTFGPGPVPHDQCLNTSALQPSLL